MSNLVVVLGQTATGKTKLAVKIAHKYNGEIVSADSRQIYKGMDIGTGKDLDEYQINNKKISHHLIDILDPNVIVLGGGVSNISFLYDEGKKAVYDKVFSDSIETPILKNSLGDSAGVFGACLLNR